MQVICIPKILELKAPFSSTCHINGLLLWNDSEAEDVTCRLCKVTSSFILRPLNANGIQFVRSH